MLVKLCQEQFGWKKSTTYTVIKKLSEKGIIKNKNTIVSALVTKEEVDRQASVLIIIILVVWENIFGVFIL